MSLQPEAPAGEPPAYTVTAPVPPTSTRRTIEDTRCLIMSNAWMMGGHMRSVGPIELVIGKARHPGARAESGSRSFVSTRSNVTIRVRDTSPAAPSRSPERPVDQGTSPGASTPRTSGKHYAALVSRDKDNHYTDVVILGEPQDTIEEALEWMLERTEIVVTEMLANHRKQASTSCCRSCGQALRGESSS
jgi:hypothetical protein